MFFFVFSDETFDGTQYFEIKPDADSYTISLKKNIPDTVLKTKKYVTVLIQAELDSKISKTTLIISLPAQEGEAQAKFERTLYKGKIKENHVIHDPIKVLTELEDKKVVLQLEDGKLTLKKNINLFKTVLIKSNLLR